MADIEIQNKLIKTLFQQTKKVKTVNDKIELSITILKLKELGVFNDAQVMELRTMYELVSGVWIVAEINVAFTQWEGRKRTKN